MSETTRWLIEWGHGNEEALGEVLPRIYRELSTIASRYLRREREGHTLETSALVHEAYFRLIDQNQATWQNRSHFLAIASQAMRRILVDHARKKTYLKHGGDAVRADLDDAMIPDLERPESVLFLDDALNRLAKIDADKAKLVELRFFGGLDVHETAAALGVSVPTLTRRWRLVKAWLYRELQSRP